MKKTDRVKQDIAKCWALLRREQADSNQKSDTDTHSATDSSHIIRQLKATFKFYHPYKLTKNILNLESTLHRVALSQDGRFIYAGGNGCKIRKRDLSIQTNNTFSDKSRPASRRVQRIRAGTGHRRPLLDTRRPHQPSGGLRREPQREVRVHGHNLQP